MIKFFIMYMYVIYFISDLILPIFVSFLITDNDIPDFMFLQDPCSFIDIFTPPKRPIIASTIKHNKVICDLMVEGQVEYNYAYN
jgi:hypothetical protein